MHIRAFNWTEAEIGVVYGGIMLVFATLGMIAGSWIAMRLQMKGYKDALLRVPLWMTLVMTPLVSFRLSFLIRI